LPIQVPINIHKVTKCNPYKSQLPITSAFERWNASSIPELSSDLLAWHTTPQADSYIIISLELVLKGAREWGWRTTLFSTCVDLHQNSKRLSSQPTHSPIQVICNLQSPTEWIFRTSYIQREVGHLQRRN
jgi:hypothetical protein